MNWKAINWKALLKTLAVGAAGGAIGALSDAVRSSGIDLTAAAPVIAALMALLIKNPWQKPAVLPPPQAK
jgi:uncharacterized membrane protein YfcA